MIEQLLTQFQARLAARREERGASAVEYGLLIAGIAALIVVAVFALGPVVRDAFDNTCDKIKTGDGAAQTCDAPATGGGGSVTDPE